MTSRAELAATKALREKQIAERVKQAAFAKAAREEACERLAQALSARGVEIDVWGCGCCESPHLKVRIDGEDIFDEEDAKFSNMSEFNTHAEGADA